jgi:predicted signal transduction protein with EAL and GGDEF domain
MIGRMTETLLAKAIAAARLWPTGVGLCFNLSAKDLINADTMAKVRELTQSGGLAPARIEFEVTETALLQDFDRAAAAIETLHKLGARVALDDFGTGFSSLGYVHRLKLDKIKIDRSFVADVDVSRTAPSIIKTIVDLCRNLELDCVVEGVETKAQLDVIVSLGCRFIQGYLFSRPVPGDAVTRLIAQLEPAAAVCEAAALPVQALGNIVS